MGVTAANGERLSEGRGRSFGDEQVAEFAAALQAYRRHRVTGDRYAGEWPRERFREHGIQYEPAEQTRSDLYRDLLPLLTSATVELLDHPRLVAQLCALERRTARGGKDSIDHGPGGHDDLINAAAGALLRAQTRASARLCCISLPLPRTRRRLGITNPFHPLYDGPLPRY